MKNKQIIILIVVIFLALVGYKVISSSIQESKEKAVLQERYQLNQLQENQNIANQQKITAQLNLCLEDAKNKASSAYIELGLDKPESKCDKYKNNIDAQTACMKGFVTVQNQVIAQMDQDKNECYKRYK